MHPLLSKALESKRLATAYLLYGPEESPKKEEAALFAKGILGKAEFTNHPDFHPLRPQKGSLKIEEVRKLTEDLSLKPMQGNYAVAWIEEAETLTDGAANALLKTLEEPPPYAVFLLLTSIPEKLPSTIRSRCHRIPFWTVDESRNPPWETVLPIFREKIFPALNQKNGPSFTKASELAEGFLQEIDSLNPFFDLLQAWWRDLILFSATCDKTLLKLASEKEIQGYLEKCDEEKLFQGLEAIQETHRAVEGNVLKQLALERLFYQLS